MNATGLLRLAAQQLFPGFGFFAAGPDFCLHIPLDQPIDRLDISVEAPKPEFLNLGAIEFLDAQGKAIDRSLVVASAILSSGLGATGPQVVLEKVRNGQSLHSAQEPRPCLTLRLTAPNDVAALRIHNRDDRFGRRSNHLVVVASAGETQVAEYRNGAEARLFALFDSACTLAGVQPEPLKTTADVLPLVARIQKGLQQAFKAKAPDWTVLHLSQFLPLNLDRPGATKFQLRVAAVIMLKLLGKSEYIQTNRLKPLASFLRSSLVLSRVREEATRLNQAWTRDDVLIVLAKHGIHRARLLQRREQYLDAVEKAIAFFRPLGIEIILCYGTLLGAVRDQGFIPHDDDIDLLILNGATSREDADAKKAEILRLMAEKKIAFWDGGENFQATFNGRSLDFFICWEQGDKIELMMEQYRYRTIDKAILTPISEVTFYGRTFPAPGKPEAFLAERYGSGWATPDPYYEFPWPVERYDQPLPGPAAAAVARRADRPRRSLGRTAMVSWGQRIGKSGESAPRNSLPLIDEAIRHGFDMIELEVRISGDGVPVLAQDAKVTGPKGSIQVEQTTAANLGAFPVGEWQKKPVHVPTLRMAFGRVKGKDLFITPRMAVDRLHLLRQCLDEARIDPASVTFCVSGIAMAHEMLRLFPESVLMWKIGLPFHDIGETDLDEAVALGMDGVMLIWPMHDQDFSTLTAQLKERNLRVLYYIHGGGWPSRPYADQAQVSLQKMIEAGADYVMSTQTGKPLPEAQAQPVEVRPGLFAKMRRLFGLR